MALRFDPPVPSTLNLPDWIWGSVWMSEPSENWLWPPSCVDHRGAAPLELHDLEIDAGHHLEELGPQVLEAADARRSEQINWPGFCFASAMSSFTELAGTLGWTVSDVRPARQLGDRDKGLSPDRTAACRAQD